MKQNGETIVHTRVVQPWVGKHEPHVHAAAMVHAAQPSGEEITTCHTMSSAAAPVM
jgi:hypothetical protein